MGTIVEQSIYESGIYQLELTDPLQGGEDGISNLQAKQLANRTLYLKNLLEVQHTPEGSHLVDSLKTELLGALSDSEVADDAEIDEEKLNLYFRGTIRPGGRGTYETTRDMAEDLARLSDMHSLGDLLLSKAALSVVQDLTRQYYPSSGVLFAGGSSYAGYTPILSGADGGGIFTQDTASESLANKLPLVGNIVLNVDGYALTVSTPDNLLLPAAPSVFTSSARTDLVYFEVQHVNLTLGASFYYQGNTASAASSWEAMTETAKKNAAIDVHNNLYMGSDYNVYQIQYAFRAAEGAGSLLDAGFVKTAWDTNLYNKDDLYAIELLLLNRRNTGAFHSVYNPLGTGVFYGANQAMVEDEDTHVILDAPVYDITATNTADNFFTIAGNHVAEFPVDYDFTASGTLSASNDGDFTVQQSVYDSGDDETYLYVTSDLTDNTGNTGTMSSSLWFKINYCMTHVAEGLGSALSGSTASGLCYYEESGTVIPQAYHDHIMQDDVTDKRVFLETAEPAADPALTLGTPVLHGIPLSLYELQTYHFDISNYNSELTYSVSALFYGTYDAAGSISETDGTVSWIPPDVSANQIVILTISAEDSEANFSDTGQYILTVQPMSIDADDAVIVSDVDWVETSNLSVSSGLTANLGDAYAVTDSFTQAETDSDWGKLQISETRDLYLWGVDGSSTISSLVLLGDHEITAGNIFAVKYSGSDEVFFTQLNIDVVTWNGSTQNTLTLSSDLAEVPEKVWDADVAISYGIGTDFELLTGLESLSLDTGSTNTTQVVGDSAVSDLWVSGAHNNTVGITVNGTDREVEVYSVSVSGSTYTLQIPEQSASPTAAWKPSVFVDLGDSFSAAYNAVSEDIGITHTAGVVYAQNIRQLKFRCDLANAGSSLKALSCDLWKQI